MILTQRDVVQALLKGKSIHPARIQGRAFAPANIALCKYWGKRNLALHLPINSSLSISLAHKGAYATLESIPASQHELIFNGKLLTDKSPHVKRWCAFLNLFLPTSPHHAYRLTVEWTLPVAAGLASSACAYAATIKAFNEYYDWQCTTEQLSILARLGSGSAARSLYSGFAEWHRGNRADGMDSYASPLADQWPELIIGLCLIDTHPKTVSSREGMQHTVRTSLLYSAWPEQAARDLCQLKNAIAKKDFALLGQAAESNALAMHATLLAAWPPLLYSTPDTIRHMQTIWDLRQKGLPVYFTQDAGPNLKLLFLENHIPDLLPSFPTLDIIRPFHSAEAAS